MANGFLQYRNAGAAARQVLIDAAADWGVHPARLYIVDGQITSGGQSAPIADVVAAALPAPPNQACARPTNGG